jgi:hypothetical protein
MVEPKDSSGERQDQMGVLLGKMALDRGLITAEQLRDALIEQGRDVEERMHRTPKNPAISDMYLTPTQAKAVSVPLAQSLAAPPPDASPAFRPDARPIEVKRPSAAVVWIGVAVHSKSCSTRNTIASSWTCRNWSTSAARGSVFSSRLPTRPTKTAGTLSL